MWSTRDRSEENLGSKAWFLIRETRHRSVSFSYVFQGTDGEETQIVLGQQARDDQRYQLYRYGRSSSTEQPMEQPSEDDEDWHSIGRSVDIGKSCVENPIAAVVTEVSETSSRTGSSGRLSLAIADGQRDENCHVIATVSYSGDALEMAGSATFLLRETRHRSISFTRKVQIDLGTVQTIDLGDRATFGGKSNIRI